MTNFALHPLAVGRLCLAAASVTLAACAASPSQVGTGSAGPAPVGPAGPQPRHAPYLAVKPPVEPAPTARAEDTAQTVQPRRAPQPAAATAGGLAQAEAEPVLLRRGGDHEGTAMLRERLAPPAPTAPSAGAGGPMPGAAKGGGGARSFAQCEQAGVEQANRGRAYIARADGMLQTHHYSATMLRYVIAEVERCRGDANADAMLANLRRSLAVAMQGCQQTSARLGVCEQQAY